ncbi:hypothetical protein SAMN04489718_0724 [Actinopolyspora saharensis]|uniref:Uncharacterized protein n=1 Tax=Actinopolyspora saharensis TaxID=995062 RepID=A0A1H0YXI7_9ACTN|nr:hypothetical protein SAMN04489718_0724 [Actinopolyspora saharensis]
MARPPVHHRHDHKTPPTSHPTAVLYTPAGGATWLANTIAAHSTDAVAVEWGTPWGVLIDTPGSDRERGEYALAHGGSVDALVLTTTGQLYLYLDPHTREQCPDHRPQDTSVV